MVIGPQQLSNLLNVTNVTSSDYNSVKALVQGELDTFMGFKFITSTRLSKTSTKRKVLAFAQDGIKLAIGKDLMTKVDERSDKGYATQVYVCQSIGKHIVQPIINWLNCWKLFCTKTISSQALQVA